jgi:TonB-dependent SusC/RagA subfamily outer membrane receptor
VQLACASAGGKRTDAPATPPATVAGGGGSGVPNTDAKSVENLFAGRFPGVTVTAADGGGLQIRIRGGGNTVHGSNEPLYIVDDSPLPPGTGGIVLLNPYDIQKIEVLKNPADIVVYGARGTNGVVKITTTRPGRR